MYARPAPGNGTRSDWGTAQQRLDACHELECIEGLGDVVIGSQLEAHNLIARLAPGSQNDHGRGQSSAANVCANLQAAAQWQHDVQDNKVKRELSSLLHSLFAVDSEINHVAFAAQTIPESHAQCFFIFNDQNVFIHTSVWGRDCGATTVISGASPSAVGRCKVKVLPTESSLTTEILPPRPSAIRLAKDNPKPVP